MYGKETTMDVWNHLKTIGWMGLVGGTLLQGLSQPVEAHPFSQEEYSLRTAVTLSDRGVVPLVVLEVPIPIALKEIGAAVSDPKDVKRRKITAYNKAQWEALSTNLTFTVNGKPAEGEWLAIDHPANGKATEGFFVYMVSFKFSKVPELGSVINVVIENKAYPDSKMVYSGSATAKEPWVIDSSTSKTILGENEIADLIDLK
jgi:hypothetical protein